MIENSEKKPLRVFTHVSENDNGANRPEESYHNWVMANDRTAAALKAKGYDYRYIYSLGAGHTDPKVFNQTLADTLVWMWRGGTAALAGAIIGIAVSGYAHNDHGFLGGSAIPPAFTVSIVGALDGIVLLVMGRRRQLACGLLCFSVAMGAALAALPMIG